MNPMSQGHLEDIAEYHALLQSVVEAVQIAGLKKREADIAQERLDNWLKLLADNPVHKALKRAEVPVHG